MTNMSSDARGIIDSNDYMTLATADGDGRPWASPVWYAHESYTNFIWMSRPQARHSRNVAARPQIGAVIFDSTVPPGQGQAVYLEAIAAEVTGDKRPHLIAIYSHRSVERGAGQARIADVTTPAPLRLYAATVTELYVLCENDQRIPIAPSDL
jgi:hypothetical protein